MLKRSPKRVIQEGAGIVRAATSKTLPRCLFSSQPKPTPEGVTQALPETDVQTHTNQASSSGFFSKIENNLPLPEENEKNEKQAEPLNTDSLEQALKEQQDSQNTFGSY